MSQKIKLPKAKTFEPGSVIAFEVKDGEESPLDTYKNLLTEAEKTSLKGKIIGADVSNPAALTLTYDGRITIKLGTFADIPAKLKLAAGAVEKEDRIERFRIAEDRISSSEIGNCFRAFLMKRIREKLGITEIYISG